MTIWLDVTTTLAWRRPALGIVRVEAETLRYFLSVDDNRVRFCRFEMEAGNYYEVPRDIAANELARLDAGGQGVPHALPVMPPQPFDSEDIYVSLGIDWDQKNLQFLYTLKKQIRLKIVLFCYDIIPILMPEFCVQGVPEKFPTYFVNAAWCADLILCISKCSKDDLRHFLENVGAPTPDLDVVRLGGDLPAGVSTLPSPEISSIVNERYILFVSTIEARKNHQVLYKAYKKLIESGRRDIPMLVFVGMPGWGVDELFNNLKRDKDAQKYMRCLNHVSDSDLAHLYKNCLFTVYPSFYEGWGLPVAESLAYGKFCLASDAGSIPEVGESLIEYVQPKNENLWAERLDWYFKNPQEINNRQKLISEKYRPSTWKETGMKIFNLASTLND